MNVKEGIACLLLLILLSLCVAFWLAAGYGIAQWLDHAHGDSGYDHASPAAWVAIQDGDPGRSMPHEECPCLCREKPEAKPSSLALHLLAF